MRGPRLAADHFESRRIDEDFDMGKGDRKTAKGKRYNSSYGNARSASVKTASAPAAKRAVAKPAAKAPAAKKAVARKAAKE
jgi:30S ribosomal protein S31